MSSFDVAAFSQKFFHIWYKRSKCGRCRNEETSLVQVPLYMRLFLFDSFEQQFVLASWIAYMQSVMYQNTCDIQQCSPLTCSYLLHSTHTLHLHILNCTQQKRIPFRNIWFGWFVFFSIRIFVVIIYSFSFFALAMSVYGMHA